NRRVGALGARVESRCKSRWRVGRCRADWSVRRDKWARQREHEICAGIEVRKLELTSVICRSRTLVVARQQSRKTSDAELLCDLHRHSTKRFAILVAHDTLDASGKRQLNIGTLNL